MSTVIWKLLRGLVGLDAGPWCRRCGESIERGDPFGQSERVCHPCRVREGL